MMWRQRYGHDRETNHQRVAEMQGGHGGCGSSWSAVSFPKLFSERILTVLIAEAVFSPNAACTVDAMHRIHKAIATTPSCIRTLRVLVAQQSRWHAGPQSKYHERKQIAHGKCSTTSLIEARACGRATHESTRLTRLRLIVTVSSGRVVVEPD